MPYPRQLKLGEDVEIRLNSFLNDEITRHLAERTDYIDDLKNWQRDYWAPVPKGETKTPFVGASRIIIPLTAIAFEAVHARASMALWGVKPYVSIKLRNNDSEHENAFNKWYNYELQHSIKAHRSLENSVIEIEKYGTGVGKPGYTYLTKKAVRDNPISGEREDVDVVMKRGATLDYVPIANFLMSYAALDPQKAEWVGEVHMETPYYVRQLEESGFFYPGTFDALAGWSTQLNKDATTRTVRDSEERAEHSTPVYPKEFDWFEIWASFDIDGDGKKEEIVIHWHKGANKLMSVRYNWLSDLRRPYYIGNYVRVEGRWKGIGICKQSENFQKIVTTLHRQRIDAGTIANMRMFKVHRLSGYGPNEPIFPGKMWILDDMTHIEPIQATEVYSSAFANEQAALLYEQQRVGVNELTTGMPQQGTPGTATDTTLRLQEGSKKFDMTLYNIKQFTNDMYLEGILHTKQFGSKTLDLYIQANPVDGALITDILTNTSYDNIRHAITFELETIGQQTNKTVDRQNWMQIAQILQQFITGIIQLAQVANPQAMPTVAANAINASADAFKQILETYDIRDEDKISMVNQLRMMFPIANANGQGAPPNGPIPTPGPNGGGGSPNAPNLLPNTRIQDIIQGFAGAGRNGG